MELSLFAGQIIGISFFVTLLFSFLIFHFKLYSSVIKRLVKGMNAAPWIIFGIFVFDLVFLLLSSIFFKRVKKFKMHSRWIKILVFATIVIQLIHSFIIPPDARYVSGSLTGASGIFYGISKSMTVASMLMMIKYRKYFYTFGPLIIFFVLTFILTIDGFSASLLIFFSFIFSLLSL